MLIIMLICLLLFLDLIEGQTHCESFVVHFVGRFIFFYSILIWTEVQSGRCYTVASSRGATNACPKPGSAKESKRDLFVIMSLEFVLVAIG
jgi:hypothetical protein